MRQIVLPDPAPGEQIRIAAFDESVRLVGRVEPPEDLPDVLRPGESIFLVACVIDHGRPAERRWWARRPESDASRILPA